MSEKTNIQWCDHSASPWYGCAHAEAPDGSQHPGCLNCYAETQSKRNTGTLGIWGKEGTRVVSKSFAKNCRKWNRKAEAAGVVRKSVFPSICDPFEDWQGPIHDHAGKVLYEVAGDRVAADAPPPGQSGRLLRMEDLRRDLFALIDECPWLDFLLLTKRPGNVLRMWPDYSIHACVTGDCPHDRQSECDSAEDRKYRDNVQLITSVSDQATLDGLWPELRKCRGLVPVLGLSAEPLIGPLDFSKIMRPSGSAIGYLEDFYKTKWVQPDWIIVGGESGAGAREMDIHWVWSIVRQCRRNGVAVFVKQLGANPYQMDMMGDPDVPGGSMHFAHPLDLKDKKGGDPAEWPEDLRVREFPRSPEPTP